MATHKQTLSVKQKVASVLGGIGYLMWVGQWLWLCLLHAQNFIQSSIGEAVFPSPSTVQPTPELPVPPTGAPGTPFVVPTIVSFLLGVGLIMLIFYVVTMRYLPAINRTAKKVVETVADETVKQVVAHKKVSKRKQLILTERAIFWIKMGFSLLPLGITALFRHAPMPFSANTAIFSSGVLALLAVCFFLLQAVVAGGVKRPKS